MIKLLLKIFAILVLAIFQLALISKLTIWGAIPNLILILAITLVIKNRFFDATLVALVGGIILDLASPLRFGIYLFLFLLTLCLINFWLLRTIPAPNNLIVFFIFVGAFLFLDLAPFLFITTWPS